MCGPIYSSIRFKRGIGFKGGMALERGIQRPTIQKQEITYTDPSNECV